jgi:hypothetical protein
VNEVNRRLGTHILEQGDRPATAQIVPTHVRNLQSGPGGKSDHLSGQKTQASVLAILAASIEEELKPQANSQAGPSRADGLDERSAEPTAVKLSHGVGECAHPR